MTRRSRRKPRLAPPALRSSGPARRLRDKSQALLALAVALIAIALYLPALRNGFAYDAVSVVEQDARIQTLHQPFSLLTASYWTGGETLHALYRPLVTLSFALDWALFDGAAWGFHLTNIVAHATAAVLVFLVLVRLVVDRGSPVQPPAPVTRERPSSGAVSSRIASLMPAFAGAVLFAAHPVAVEAVAGVVGRAEIFAACFSLAAVWLWVARAPFDAVTIAGAPVLFLLALMSKESAIMLPVLLVLVDVASGRLDRTRGRAWLRERVLVFAGLAVAALLFLVARHAVLGTFTAAQLDPIIETVPRGLPRVRTALQVWPTILRLLFVPRTLLADYGPRIFMPATSGTIASIGGLTLLAAAVIGGALAFLHGRRLLALTLLWIPVALLPTSNLVLPIGVILAERALYLPVFAIALATAIAVSRLRARGQTPKRVAYALVALVCVGFAIRTVARIPAWRSTDDVFHALMRDRPDSFRAQWHYARMAWRDHDHDAAFRHFRRAIALWPHRRALVLEVARFAAEEGYPSEAREFARLALERWPDDLVSMRRLASASLDMNDTTAARTVLRRGLELYPDDPLFSAMRDAIGTRDP